MTGEIKGVGGVTFIAPAIGSPADETEYGDIVLYRNTYSGGTILAGANSGVTGRAVAADDDAFGTGQILLTANGIISSGDGSYGERTIGNAIVLAAYDARFDGADDFIFTGGVTQTGSAGIRNNMAPGGGSTLYFRDGAIELGLASAPATIYNLRFTGGGKTVVESVIKNVTGSTAANTVTIGHIAQAGTAGTTQAISYRSYSDVTFEGANTYTGATTLTTNSFSKLTVNSNCSAATGLITVGGTCLLTGDGTVNGVTVSAGTVGKHNVIDEVAYDNGQGCKGGTISGNLTVRGNLTFATLADAHGANAAFYSDSLITLENNATLTIGGLIDTGANRDSFVTFQFLGDDWYYSEDEKWLLIDLTGASNTSVANLESVVIDSSNFKGTKSALSLQYLVAGVDEGVTVTGVYLVGAPIPEPSTWLLLGAGAAFVAVFRRRKKV